MNTPLVRTSSMFQIQVDFILNRNKIYSIVKLYMIILTIFWKRLKPASGVVAEQDWPKP